MVKVLFICYGNICRSPMAELLCKDKLKKLNINDVYVESRATSDEEVDSPIHFGTAKILMNLGINYKDKYAIQLTKADCDNFDYLIGMDSGNIMAIKDICGEQNYKKVYRLLEFTDKPRDILDPWYTHDFETTYYDINNGLDSFIAKICEK